MTDLPKHLVTSFEADLQKLRDMIAEMGNSVENAVAAATTALLQHDPASASRVVEADHIIDAEERAIEQFAVKLLALRQPVADDLRHVVSALKVVTDLERIGDHAANIAKRSIVITQTAQGFSLTGLGQMSELVQKNMRLSSAAIAAGDATTAIEVWRADAILDDLYNTIFRELMTYMMEDGRNISACTHLLFIAKNLERIGDHVTNIAEQTYYAITGDMLPDFRPKGDQTSTYVPTNQTH